MNTNDIAKSLWEKYSFKAGHDDPVICDEDFFTAIKEAIELHEASKWKYPAKGELPEEEKDILFVVEDRLHMGWYEPGRFCFWNGEFEPEVVGKVNIEKWQYAPEVE